MPRAASPKVGRGPCPSKYCNASVMFRKSSGGSLTFKCDDCDASGFAPPGSDSHSSWSGSISQKTPVAAAVQELANTPAPKKKTPAVSPAEPEETPAPAAKPASSVFDLGNL